MTFQSFASWTELLDHITAGYSLWYHAPLDFRPRRVSAVVRKDGKLRVYPSTTDADPFTADTAHLDRFRQLADKQARKDGTR